jgi:hypothetical protein
MSAISDDMDAYVRRCEKYDEEIQHKDRYPDCYSKHAEELKERERREIEEWNKVVSELTPKQRAVLGVRIRTFY